MIGLRRKLTLKPHDLKPRMLFLMMRFFLLEAIMAVLCFGFAWLGRRLLGRLIGGPPVILWGLFFGMLGVVAGGALFSVLGTDFGFIDFGGNVWAGIQAFILRFWDTGLIAGALGVLVASLSMWRIGNQAKVKQAQADPQQNERA
jgi:hypothetical protein